MYLELGVRGRVKTKVGEWSGQVGNRVNEVWLSPLGQRLLCRDIDGQFPADAVTLTGGCVEVVR